MSLGNLGKALGSELGKAKQKHSPQSIRRGLKLEQISDRPHGDTRELNPSHVEELAANIAAVGLIQPLAVDSEGHLLAGGHRRAALQLLEQTEPKRFTELFPHGEVLVRAFDFNAADDPERAIAIEAAENEKRRDYTPAEVRELADRLVEAGYRNSGGRPKKNQKALTPALMTIVGKSKRTVERYLANADQKTPPDDGVSKWEKRATQIERWAEESGDKGITRKATKLAADLRALEGEQLNLGSG